MLLYLYMWMLSVCIISLCVCFWVCTRSVTCVCVCVCVCVYISEEIGHVSSKLMSLMCHMHQYKTYRSIWQVSVAHSCASWRMPLGKNSVSLDRGALISTPFNPSQILSEYWGFVVAHNQSKISISCWLRLRSSVLPLSGFEIRLRKSSLTKSTIETSVELNC